MLDFKSLKEMKKVFLFFVVAMAFASCAPKAADKAPATDSTVVTVDSTTTNTTTVDSTKVDSVK